MGLLIHAELCELCGRPAEVDEDDEDVGAEDAEDVVPDDVDAEDAEVPDDVGAEDAEDVVPDDEAGTVAVGVGTDAELLIVADDVPVWVVVVPVIVGDTCDVPTVVDDDTDPTPSMVNSGLAFPESPRTTTM